MTRRALLAVVAAGVLLRCVNQPTGPQAGVLSVVLSAPQSGVDGAILFTVSGPATPTSSPTVATGDTLWGGPFTATSNQYVVTGNVRSGTLLTFGVSDVNLANQYTATISQVAASANYSLRPLTGYSLVIAK